MNVTDVLIFDIETTGIPDRNWSWELDYDKYPHVVQLAWKFGDVEESHIIRPDDWEIPEDVVAVHGITTEYALEHGKPFAAVIDLFLNDCANAPLICGHNVYFDTSIIKANILRELGRAFYDAYNVESALFKGKRIDTMRASMKWVDARMANGRLKFPNLTELYSRCFPGETFPAHDALEDVKAVAECLPVLLEYGLVKLEVREYPDGELFQKQPDNPVAAFVKTTEAASMAAQIAADAAKKFGTAPVAATSAPNSGDPMRNDKLPVQPEKVARIEENQKITEVAEKLLEQDNF